MLKFFPCNKINVQRSQHSNYCNIAHYTHCTMLVYQKHHRISTDTVTSLKKLRRYKKYATKKNVATVIYSIATPFIYALFFSHKSLRYSLFSLYTAFTNIITNTVTRIPEDNKIAFSPKYVIVTLPSIAPNTKNKITL